MQALGQLGRVEMFDGYGAPLVKVNGRWWVMETACLVPAPGEQPDDEERMQFL